MKFPTGNNGATDVFPDGNGNNNLERYVDISVNPGDGGWGLISDLQAYKMMGRFITFGSGTWLLNPRNTGAPSRGNLATTTSPTNVNTVSDQFIFRAGTSVAVTRRISASIAWRMEGVPRYDLIGRSDGFRRPGVEMYWEPGDHGDERSSRDLAQRADRLLLQSLPQPEHGDARRLDVP